MLQSESRGTKIDVYLVPHCGMPTLIKTPLYRSCLSVKTQIKIMVLLARLEKIAGLQLDCTTCEFMFLLSYETL